MKLLLIREIFLFDIDKKKGKILLIVKINKIYDIQF